ncbi:MAG: ABC transporter permease subunit [Candidatus Omnitrophica bacterium]|nr:ABC transporter permease subunit [Candidatus Omnitrophota bacterium]
MKTILIIANNVAREIFRKKDFYVLVALLIALMCYLVNITFFDIGRMHRFLIEVGLSMVFLFSIILSIPFAAKLMIDESKNKTIYPLLAKPIHRFHVILGKFLGSLYASIGCFTILFTLFSAFSLYKQGLSSLTMYMQVYSCGALMLIMLNALVICLSIFCTYSTSVTLGFAIFFLMSWFSASLRSSFENIPFLGTVIYYLLPHFEFFDLRHRLIHNWELLPVSIFAFLIIYCCIYTGLLLLASYEIFKKKWL